jgi:2,4-dienoyl-CoA reductase-like NADH-dependent reductase (Old Yellow Enzyme family)
MAVKLFEPLKIRNLVFKNRIWVSPMCQYSSSNGVPNSWHLAHLGSFAIGGAGLVFVESTGIVPEGRISIGCTGLWNDEQMKEFKKIVDFVHSQNALIGIQLAHAGRKGSTMLPSDDHQNANISEGGWQTVAPSAVAFPTYPVPHELTTPEIAELVAQFGSAAKRAVAAGFDVVEVHAAHGYLAAEFLSPLSNMRTDEYGGSLENRSRFAVEIVREVRKSIPDSMPLFVRISATEWVGEAGWDLEDSVYLAKSLKLEGADLIDVSSGGNIDYAVIPEEPGYQVFLSRTIKSEADILTTSVGVIVDPDQAEEILQSHSADAVFLGREMLRNPRWALSGAKHFGVQAPWPIQYERAKPKH